MMDVRKFGAVGDGITDDIAAFEAAIEAMGPSLKGCVLHVPPGVYRLSRALQLRKTVILEGEGSGDSGYSSTVLCFDQGADGIVVHREATSGGGLADWSAVRDICLTSAGSVQVDTVGVRMFARAHLSRVHVSRFGTGVSINTDGAGRNANGFSIRSCRVTECRGDGLFVRGSDSNAGLVEQLDVSGVGGYGVFDESLTGNTYVGCHVSAAGKRPYHLRNAGAGGMLVNCYSESGSTPPSSVADPAIVLGGTHGAGFTPESTAFRLGSRFGFTPHAVVAQHPDGKATTVYLGSEQEPMAGIRLGHTDDFAGLRLGWSNGGWVLGAVNAGDAMRINKGSNRPTFPNGLQLGGMLAPGRAAPRVWSSWGDPRTTGLNWMARRGDLILNQAASSSSRGWVCVADCGFGGRWSPGNGPYSAEVLVTPSVPNGYAYRLAADSPGWWTGNVEPVWPTTVGARVADGSTVWECYGSTTEGLVPL